jgi:hypothetical protein
MTGASWGSPTPQGPGWWQASDGLWYPPQGEQAPAAPPAHQPPAYQAPAYQAPAYQAPQYAAYPSATPVSAADPVALDLQAPYEIGRWRPLYAWLVAIPHLIVSWLYSIGAAVCLWIAFFAVLFTRQVPPGIHDFIVQAYRYQWQTTTYALWMREQPPAYGATPGAIDTGADPATLSIAHGGELARWGPLYKWILVIPHLIVLWFYGIAAYISIIVGFFGVLFGGRWPQGSRDLVVKVMRQAMRINAYVLLSDVKPPVSPS